MEQNKKQYDQNKRNDEKFTIRNPDELHIIDIISVNPIETNTKTVFVVLSNL